MKYLISLCLVALLCVSLQARLPQAPSPPQGPPSFQASHRCDCQEGGPCLCDGPCRCLTTAQKAISRQDCPCLEGGTCTCGVECYCLVRSEKYALAYREAQETGKTFLIWIDYSDPNTQSELKEAIHLKTKRYLPVARGQWGVWVSVRGNGAFLPGPVTTVEIQQVAEQLRQGSKAVHRTPVQPVTPFRQLVPQQPQFQPATFQQPMFAPAPSFGSFTPSFGGGGFGSGGFGGGAFCAGGG